MEGLKVDIRCVAVVKSLAISTIIYSITETAKANQLNPYQYLKHLLAVIPQHMEDKNLDFPDGLLP